MDDTRPAGKPPTRQSSRENHLVTAVIVYNVVLTVVMLLGALHFNSRVRSLEVLLQKEHLQNFDKPVDSTTTDIEEGKDVVKSPRNTTAMNKREVLSVNNLKSQLREHLGAFSGAVYVRWGRKDCPDQSKLIYHGLAAGSDFRSPAGGSNLQCLPSDPQYDPKYSDIKVLHSFLSKVIWDGYSHFNNLFRRQMPCAVCESNQRATKLIIPAATQCPSADWHLEYKGFLVSDYNVHASGAIHIDGNRHSRSTYECLDEYPVSFKPDEGQGGAAGTLMRLIKVSCSGDTSINYCPPYKEDQPISCVLCTK